MILKFVAEKIETGDQVIIAKEYVDLHGDMRDIVVGKVLPDRIYIEDAPDYDYYVLVEFRNPYDNSKQPQCKYFSTSELIKM